MESPGAEDAVRHFYAFLHFVPPKSVNLGGLFAINMEVIS